jgi:hypothetical protein
MIDLMKAWDRNELRKAAGTSATIGFPGLTTRNGSDLQRESETRVKQMKFE